jgi:hypothetical protein
LISLDIDILAAQLTIYESRLMSQLCIYEFLKMRWQKQKAEAPTLVALADHFNKIARWAIMCILDEKTPKDRAKMAKKLIALAKV